MVTKIRVLVVDDSALVRGLLAEIIDRQPDMLCVGAASASVLADASRLTIALPLAGRKHTLRG